MGRGEMLPVCTNQQRGGAYREAGRIRPRYPLNCANTFFFTLLHYLHLFSVVYASLYLLQTVMNINLYCTLLVVRDLGKFFQQEKLFTEHDAG